MHQDVLDLLRAFIDGNVRFLIVGTRRVSLIPLPTSCSVKTSTMGSRA